MMSLHHLGHYGLEKLDQNRKTRTKEISGLFVGGMCFFFFLFLLFSYTCSGLSRLDTSLSCSNIEHKNTYLRTMQSFCSLVNVLKPAVIQSLWSVYWPMGSASVDKSTVLQRFSMSTSEWLFHNIFPTFSPRKETNLRSQQLIMQKQVDKSESSLGFTMISSPHSMYWRVSMH